MMNYLYPIYQSKSRTPQRETERDYLMRVAREKDRLERQERRRSMLRKITGRRSA
jgi:hypothetical protein